MPGPLRLALVDDDTAILDALCIYFDLKGLSVTRFDNAASCLRALDAGLSVDCIVSDVRMPEFDGIALFRKLALHHGRIPVILITGHGDIDLAVAAIKEGVDDFIQKPFNEERLLSAIEGAVARAQTKNLNTEQLEELANRVSRLSERQREVMVLAAQGLTNKEIANTMGIGPRTVESYRAWVMERVGARNLAELIKIAMRLGLSK